MIYISSRLTCSVEPAVRMLATCSRDHRIEAKKKTLKKQTVVQTVSNKSCM